MDDATTDRDECRAGFLEAQQEMAAEWLAAQAQCAATYVQCAYPVIGGVLTLSSPAPLSDDEQAALLSIGCDAFVSAHATLDASLCEGSLEAETPAISPAQAALEVLTAGFSLLAIYSLLTFPY
jgi:hypothetical protein